MSESTSRESHITVLSDNTLPILGGVVTCVVLSLYKMLLALAASQAGEGIEYVALPWSGAPLPLGCAWAFFLGLGAVCFLVFVRSDLPGEQGDARYRIDVAENARRIMAEEPDISGQRASVALMASTSDLWLVKTPMWAQVGLVGVILNCLAFLPFDSLQFREVMLWTSMLVLVSTFIAWRRHHLRNEVARQSK